MKYIISVSPSSLREFYIKYFKVFVFGLGGRVQVNVQGEGLGFNGAMA